MTNFAYAPTAYRAMAAAGADVIRRYQLNVHAMSSAGEPLNPEVIRFFPRTCGRHDPRPLWLVGDVDAKRFILRNQEREKCIKA